MKKSSFKGELHSLVIESLVFITVTVFLSSFFFANCDNENLDTVDAGDAADVSMQDADCEVQKDEKGDSSS